MSRTADSGLSATITYQEIQSIYDETMTELRSTTAKLEKSVTKRNILQRNLGKLVRNLKMMKTDDVIARSAAVVGTVVGAVEKFQSGNPVEYVSGALDIATSVLDFAPPPFSLASGN